KETDQEGNSGRLGRAQGPRENPVSALPGLHVPVLRREGPPLKADRPGPGKVGCAGAPRGRPGLLSRTSRAGTSIDGHRVRTRINNPRGRLDSSRKREAGRTQAGTLRLRQPVARTSKTVRFTTQD